LFDQPIVMLDFETTGLSPAMGDRITEVAALRIVEGRITERFVSLVNCQVRIPAFVTALTGITQRMVDQAPPAREVVPRLVEFIGTDALAAHNASFDARFLAQEARMQGLASAHDSLICSLMLARRVYPGRASYKLGALAQALNIRFGGNAHRAEADAEVSAHLLLHIGGHLRRTYGCTELAPRLLAAINRQSAAKVPDFVRKQVAANERRMLEA
jgi:DNA polymerase-3 subunit epsilon